jgi:hypothetical protein
MIDYVLISKYLDDDFTKVTEMFRFDYLDAKNILIHIKNHNKLKVLLENYDYCEYLNASYQGLNKDLEFHFKSNFLENKNKEELKKEEKNQLFRELKHRLLAHYLELTYKICEQKRIQKSLIAYSHRKVGWSTPKYDLSPYFSVELKTNFGYGYVSYFYTIIKYKEIEIIPFSDWIRYEKADLFEIIRYSAKHKLTNESWLEALEFSKEACNISILDENEFVRIYIIEECERLVSGLEEFLKVDKFIFVTEKRIYTDAHKHGHNLIEFRGEKISGALSFIESILKFKEVLEVLQFVERIEIVNKVLHPILQNEISLINRELNVLKVKKDIKEPFYLELEIKNNEYNNLRKIIAEGIVNGSNSISSISIDHNDVREILILENPEYLAFESLYKIKKAEFLALIAEILSLETTLANMEKYIKTIERYFENKTLMVS